MAKTWRRCKAAKRAMIGMLCLALTGLQSLAGAAETPGRYAKNMSFPTLCSEEDNVNIPLYGGYVAEYEITATFPTYYPLKPGQADLCDPVYTGCEHAWDMRPTAQIAYYDATAQKLKFAWQSPGYYWYPLETPDQVHANVGSHVSLAYPPTDRHWLGLAAPPAMAYYDAEAKRLLYIVRDTLGNWSAPEVVDASGDAGQYPALRIGRDKRHHIVYYDAQRAALKYTYKRDPDAAGGWAAPIILDKDGDVGKHAAMAIGPAGKLHVAYYNASAKRLQYLTHDDARGWSAPVVLDADGDVGQYASITVYYELRPEKMGDAYAGRYPHIAYYDATHGNLKYVYQNEQGWSRPVALDTDGDVGQYASLFFGPDGALHLAYYDAAKQDLKYLYKGAGAGQWPAPTVLDADGDVGRFASLGVSAKGYPNIAYYDASHQQLKFLSKTKDSEPNWHPPRVIDSGGVGQYASLVTSGFVDQGDLEGEELYHDGDVIVGAVDVPGWPFESGMAVHVVGGKSTPEHDYIRIHKRADDGHDAPQIFVLYANGYARMIPQPPAWREERVCFGASVIIGPAAEDPLYPITAIERLDIDPKKLTVQVTYKNGSAAMLHLWAERGKTTLRVSDVTYDTVTAPFATLRSMWLADDNSDVAKVTATSAAGATRMHGMDPTHEEWTTLPGDAWLFHRPTYSRHNTSCPDFKIDVIGPRGYLLTQQAEDYHSGTVSKTPRPTASKGHTARGPGEAIYMLRRG